jgi:hypothetical protein
VLPEEHWDAAFVDFGKLGRDQGRELIRGDWIAKTTRGHDVGNKQFQRKLAKLLAKGLILSTTETPHAEATIF